MIRTLAPLVLASSLLVACGDDATPVDAGASDAGASDAGASDAGASDAGASDAGPPGDLTRDFCAPLAALICARADTCACDAILPGGALDRAACEARFTARCTMAWGPLASGGALVDIARAAACVARIEASTPACEEPGDAVLLALCEPFAAHPAAIGQPCESPFCAGGEGTCGGGICTARADLGAACESPFTCRTGLVCVAGRCAAPGAEGATCIENAACDPPLRCVAGACRALGSADATCSDTSQCGALLTCEDDACAPRATETCSPTDTCGNLAVCVTPRACAPRGAVGASCEESRDCEPALWCDAGTCATRATLAQTCSASGGRPCVPELACDADVDGVCRALPSAGAACLFDETGPVRCADGLACIDGTCGPLPTEGQTCAIGNVCAPGLGCDFSPEGSLCIVPRGEGGSCESSRSCADGLHCDGGSCVPDLPNGAACSLGDDCQGICAPSASGGFACRPAPGEGEPCVSDDDCGAARTCAPVPSTSRCLPEICNLI